PPRCPPFPYTTLFRSTLPNSLSDCIDPRSTSIVPYYVRRAEIFIRQESRNPISLAEIASAAGVSPRSLLYGFKRYKSVSPMKYLDRKSTRLNSSHVKI